MFAVSMMILFSMCATLTFLIVSLLRVMSTCTRVYFSCIKICTEMLIKIRALLGKKLRFDSSEAGDANFSVLLT